MDFTQLQDPGAIITLAAGAATVLALCVLAVWTVWTIAVEIEQWRQERAQKNVQKGSVAPEGTSSIGEYPAKQRGRDHPSSSQNRGQDNTFSTSRAEGHIRQPAIPAPSPLSPREAFAQHLLSSKANQPLPPPDPTDPTDPPIRPIPPIPPIRPGVLGVFPAGSRLVHPGGPICPVCAGHYDASDPQRNQPCKRHRWLQRLHKDVVNGAVSDWRATGHKHHEAQQHRAAIPWRQELESLF